MEPVKTPGTIAASDRAHFEESLRQGINVKHAGARVVVATEGGVHGPGQYDFKEHVVERTVRDGAFDDAADVERLVALVMAAYDEHPARKR